MCLICLNVKQTGILCLLDDFLGVIFALAEMTRTNPDWNGRPAQRTFRDPKVLAKELSEGKVRNQGKWMAGFHFNSALFRLAAVFHRGLKVLALKPEEKDVYRKTLLQIVQPAYTKVTGHNWNHNMLERVHDEVNGLKHAPSGVAIKRDVDRVTCLEAVDQLLDLFEVWASAQEWDKNLGNKFAT